MNAIVPTITSNTQEYSRTVERMNGSKVDFCTFKSDKALIIGITSPNEGQTEEVLLSAQEAKVLLDHLLDALTQRALA